LASLDMMYIWMYTQTMPKSYTVAGARAKLAAIVDEVESGKDVELTRRGKKVAVVMSAARYARLRGDRVAFMTAYETFRADHDLKALGLDPSWAHELRDRDPGRGVKL
jgi:prevent-host-death family protein